MKRLLIAAAAAATLAASFGGAASAQNYGYPQHQGYGQQYGHNQGYGYANGGYVPVSQRLDRIDDRIERGVRRGDLTRREAALLRRDFDNLIRLEARYRYDGFNRWEREDLQRRTTQLAQRVRYERRDPEQRYDRDDDDDRYDDGRRYGRNDDRRYDDRRY